MRNGMNSSEIEREDWTKLKWGRWTKCIIGLFNKNI